MANVEFLGKQEQQPQVEFLGPIEGQQQSTQPTVEFLGPIDQSESISYEPASEQQYGMRADGTQKGKGYFGELKRPDGSISTELSIGVNIDGKEIEIPTLIPTLDDTEVEYLLSGNAPTQEIVDKAVEHAKMRMNEGKSPFAQEGEQIQTKKTEKPSYLEKIGKDVVGVSEEFTKKQGAMLEAGLTAATGLVSWIPAGLYAAGKYAETGIANIARKQVDAAFEEVAKEWREAGKKIPEGFEEEWKAERQAEFERQLSEAKEGTEKIQEKLTYKPKFFQEDAEGYLKIVNAPFAWLSEKGAQVGDAIVEAGIGGPYSNELAALVHTAIEGAPFWMPVAAKSGFKMVKGKPTGKPAELPKEAIRPIEEAPKIETGTVVAEKVKPKEAPIIEEAKIVPEERPRTPAEEKFVAEREAAEQVAKEEMPSAESLEAAVKGGATGELPKYAEGSAINLERIEGPQDFKQFINEMTVSAKEKIGKKPMTVEEIKTRGESLGLSAKEANRLARSRDLYSSEMAAVEQIHRNAAENMFDTIRNMPADPSLRTPEMLAKVAEQTQFYSDILAATSRMKSEWGRAGVMQRQMKRFEKGYEEVAMKQKIIDQIVKRYGGDKKINEVIDALRDIDPTDIAAMNKAIRALTKPTAWDHVKRIMYDAYLSLPTTHEANMIGNSLRYMWKFPEKGLWAGYEIIRGALPGKKRAVYLREIKPEIIGTIHGIKKGVLAAWQTIKSGEGLTEQTKLADIGRAAKAKLPGVAENIRPTTILQAADELASAIIYESELATLSYRKATQMGLKGRAKEIKIAELMQDEIIKERAWQQALELTWRQEMGPIGKQILKLRNVKIPGTEVQPLVPFIPFIQTGANIARFTWEATPAHLPATIFKAARGQIKGEQITLELARTTLGTAVAATAYMMAKDGLITGGGPKSKKERDVLYRTGWLPYALTPKFTKKIGLDGYIQISRYEPFSSLFGIAADLHEGLQEKTEDEKFNMISAMLESASKNIMSKTWWMGATNIINAASDPERFGERFIENFVRTPIPAISRGIARSFDEYYRDPQTLWDAVKVGIPGLTQTVTPKINIWGEPIERAGTPATRLISPSQYSAERGDPIDKELARLDLNIGMMSKKISFGTLEMAGLPQKQYEQVKKISKPIELTPQQYIKMMKVFGSITKSDLNEMVQTEEYKQLNDGEKAKTINAIVQKARTIAKFTAMINVMKTKKEKK
jgi:hypothetical protein